MAENNNNNNMERNKKHTYIYLGPSPFQAAEMTPLRGSITHSVRPSKVKR